MFFFNKLFQYLNDYSIVVVADKNIIDSNFKTISSIINATTDDLTFYSDFKLKDQLINTKAKACFIKSDNAHLLPADCFPIIVKEPYLAYAHTTNFLYPAIKNNFFI